MAISSDTRDRHETISLLLQPPRSPVQAQVTVHTSLPGRLCSPPLPWSRDPGTTSLGEDTARLRLVQLHGSLCHHRLAPHSIALPPHSLHEPELPNQLLLKPRSVWVGNRHPQATYTQRRGPNPKLNPRSCANKEEKGKFLPAASGAAD